MILARRPLVASGLAVALLFAGAAHAATSGSPAPPTAAGRLPGLPSGIAAAALAPEPKLPTPATWSFSDAFPRTSGTGRVADGAMLWTDWVYDAHGAKDNSAQPGAGLSVPEGSYAYPEGPSNGNGADIFRAGVGLDRTSSVWRVDWNTLVDPSVPIAAWTFDTDANSATGGAAWPASANLSSAGIERALVVSAQQATLVDATTGQALQTLPVHVDEAARSFIVAVPHAVLPVDGTWRVRLAAGLADLAGTGFAVPTLNGGAAAAEAAPRAYNVTFRRNDQESPQYTAPSTAAAVQVADAARNVPVVGSKGVGAVHGVLVSNPWADAAQAHTLASGDVSAFAVDVDWRALERRKRTTEPLVRGWSNRWYVTDLDLGQGVDPAQSGTPFVGRVQPYAVYVPQDYAPDERAPLTLLLHSASVNYNQYAGGNPRLTRELCEERGSICLTPQAFGPSGLYQGIAEHDVFQVWREAAEAFTLDTERTVVTGFSMGGLASFVMPATYPELFAAAMPLDGGFDNRCSPLPPGASNFVINAAPDRSANTHWVPYVISDSYTDELSPYVNKPEMIRRLTSAGNRFSLYSTTMPEHVTTSIADGFATQVAALGGTPKRTTAPATVDYTWCPATLDPELGLGPTSVYWLSGLQQRSADTPSTTSRLVATSAALPDDNVSQVLDTAVVAPDDAPPMHVLTNSWNALGRKPSASTLRLDLTNVSALTVDTAAARLPAADAHVQTDGETLLTLTRLPAGTVVRAGHLVGTADRSGTVTLALPSGSSPVTWSR